ncbi:MAG: hypothetical protein ACTSR2_06965 [Candidatus Hodarchaeales archaeon]
MEIEDFASKILKFKKPVILEVYQGYLIAGKIKKQSKCLWINKQNIEGLAEIAKIVAIESAFHGILSFIPGGSFAYRLIKDQIGYPPRHNIFFDPKFYKVSYSVVTIDKEGKQKKFVNSVIQGVDNLAKLALKTGDTIADLLKLKNEDTPRTDKIISADTLGFTYIRFNDLVSEIKDNIVKKRLEETKSTPVRVTKAAVAELTPSIVVSFKTTANIEAKSFLQQLDKLGFQLEYVDSFL